MEDDRDVKPQIELLQDVKPSVELLQDLKPEIDREFVVKPHAELFQDVKPQVMQLENEVKPNIERDEDVKLVSCSQSMKFSNLIKPCVYMSGDWVAELQEGSLYIH